MDALTKTIALQDLLQIASLSGATHQEGGPVHSGAVCFTHLEFETFIAKLFEHQVALMDAYAASRKAEFWGDAVPLSLLQAHLAEKLGIDR